MICVFLGRGKNILLICVFCLVVVSCTNQGMPDCVEATSDGESNKSKFGTSLPHFGSVEARHRGGLHGHKVEFLNLIFDDLPLQLPPLPPFMRCTTMKRCTYYALYNEIMRYNAYLRGYDDEFMNCQDEFADLPDLVPVSSWDEQVEDYEIVD